MRLAATHRLRNAAGVSVLLGLALVGCSSSGDEPLGLDAPEADAADDGPTTAPEPTPTPDDDPTGDATADAEAPDTVGGRTHQFPKAGLTVIEPGEVPAEFGHALDRYVEFAREWRWSLREVEISETIENLATPDKFQSLERSIDHQSENGIHYDGELTVELEFDDGNDHVVTFTGCVDVTDYVWVDDDGEHAVRGSQGNETAELIVTVTNNAGIWLVTEAIQEDEPC